MTAPESGLSLLVVDDHTIVRQGLTRILKMAEDAWRVVEAASGAQAIEAMARQRFDVAIVDLSMPGMSGLELTRHIKTEWPSTAVIVLSMHAETQYAMRAFKNGASAYLTKDAVSEDLVAAVRKVRHGSMFVTAGQAEWAIHRLNHRPSASAQDLSERELEVLRRLVEGERPKEIADAMCLSIKTVSTHKMRMQQKIGVSTTAGLVRYGIERGFGGEARPAEDPPSD